MKEIVNNNINFLRNNSYPGRGIIIGKTPSTNEAVQIYWIMGRSKTSRNRFFRLDQNGFIKTEIYDATILTASEDTSLIVYYPAKHVNGSHIISNGDQTDTIYDYIENKKSFEEALDERIYEPDSPNNTPRISGIIDHKDRKYSYRLSIIKSLRLEKVYCYRCFFNYASFIDGAGHCITTYKGDGNPLPSFEGEPLLVNLFDNIDETLGYYWNILNNENKISILAKYIDLATGRAEIKIINKNNFGR